MLLVVTLALMEEAGDGRNELEFATLLRKPNTLREAGYR